MAVGTECIDLDLIRCGGMRRMFGGVYAPATLGRTLREFTHGHTLQLASVLRAHLGNLVTATGMVPGLAEQAFIDRYGPLLTPFGHTFAPPGAPGTSAAEIGALTAIEFHGNRRMVAVAEPTRRGGGSALVVDPR